MAVVVAVAIFGCWCWCRRRRRRSRRARGGAYERTPLRNRTADDEDEEEWRQLPSGRMWRPVPEDEGRRPDDGRARLEAGVGLALADRALATASKV